CRRTPEELFGLGSDRVRRRRTSRDCELPSAEKRSLTAFLKLLPGNPVFPPMKTFVSTLVIVFIASLGYSQTKVEFEVASIKPVSEQTPADGVQIGLHVDGSQVRYSALSLKEYIAQAYQVKLYQVSGPDWLAGQRFEIAAKLPEGSKMAQVPEMLQNLLADRFNLKLHRDSKEFPVYG